MTMSILSDCGSCTRLYMDIKRRPLSNAAVTLNLAIFLKCLSGCRVISLIWFESDRFVSSLSVLLLQTHFLIEGELDVVLYIADDTVFDFIIDHR